MASYAYGGRALELQFHPMSSKDQGRVHQFCTKVIPGIFIGYALNAGEVELAASEIHVKRFQSEEVDILERNNAFVFPMQGEILQVRQPLYTAVYKAGSDIMRESQQHSSEEREEARDPDTEVEDYTHRNHVAPRTKLNVPNGDFPKTPKFTDIQRQTKTSIDELHMATIDDERIIDDDKSLSEPWIGLT